MKRTLILIVTTFAVTLAIMFGIRASVDALAVVLGVVLGVVASVPTTFLVTYLLTRPRTGHDASPPQPPVVVINAADKPAVSTPPTLPSPDPPRQTRKWTVIGDTDTDLES